MAQPAAPSRAASRQPVRPSQERDAGEAGSRRERVGETSSTEEGRKEKWKKVKGERRKKKRRIKREAAQSREDRSRANRGNAEGRKRGIEPGSVFVPFGALLWTTVWSIFRDLVNVWRREDFERWREWVFRKLRMTRGRVAGGLSRRKGVSCTDGHCPDPFVLSTFYRFSFSAPPVFRFFNLPVFQFSGPPLASILPSRLASALHFTP